MTARPAAALLALCLPALAAAQPYRAENLLIVNPVDATAFEVIEARGEGARGIWCAAASYAEERLGQRDGARLHVLVPLGPASTAPGRKGVTFTTDPTRLPLPPVRGYSVSVREQGYTLPTFHARQFCRDIYEDDVWRLP